MEKLIQQIEEEISKNQASLARYEIPDLTNMSNLMDKFSFELNLQPLHMQVQYKANIQSWADQSREISKQLEDVINNMQGVLSPVQAQSMASKAYTSN